MYKWFLAFRYLYTKLIALFGVASVMLCVAMVLVVLSVMGGFLDTVRARSKGLHSEIVLEGGTLQGFPYYEEFGEYLKGQLPGTVELTTPVIYTYGIFRVPATTWTKATRILGVRLDGYVAVNDFENGLHYERYYPGTTRLGLQSMPVAGMSESNVLQLPPDLEAANDKWRRQETDPEAIASFDQGPFQHAPYPYVTPAILGERVYAADLAPPRYEGPEHYGVIVGCDLLNERREDGNFNRYLARGAEVALMAGPLSRTGTTTGEPPILVPLRYVDDSRTGIFEIDSFCVYADFDMLQHKLAMDPQPLVDGGFTKARANQLLIGLKDGIDLNMTRDRIRGAWLTFCASLSPEVSDVDARAMSLAEVYTWEDLQRPFIAAVEKEKVLVTFLFTLISMVAIVLVGCIFYMIVEKKTRDIGILKSIGASGRGVAGLFIIYAGAVGLVGSILGAILGSVVVWNINDIQDLLASLNPQLRVWSPDVYSFDKIPSVVKQADAIWVASVAVLSSMIGSLIPAWIASRVWPVSALRYE
ncbi:MAG: ABC transporter permease [Phycisphaerales bacterium]|nr:MAG: ABC transporter permease [Phycisphaerales bacterium]